jgi:hypothetical protein
MARRGKRLRPNKLREEKPKGPKPKIKWNTQLFRQQVLYSGLFMFGLLVALFSARLLESTIVSGWIVFGVVLAISIPFALGLKLRFRYLYSAENLLYNTFYSAIVFGFPLGVGLLLANYHLADGTTVVKLPIERKYKVSSSRSRKTKYPAVAIRYGELTKELKFKQEQKTEVERADYIELTVKNGYLGYDVIEDVKLRVSQKY